MALFHTTVLDNQIKVLPTVDTASGSIATFDTDLTENLVEVKCQIVAKQASGTPSPVNPLPITTYTEMNVFATGKNLAHLFVDGKVPSISTGALVNSPGARSDFIRVKPNNDYTFSVSNSQQIYVFFYEENTVSTFISYSSTVVGVTSLTVTIPNNCSYVMLRTASNDYTGGQFEKGSITTTYEPFGTTSNIPFGQTVANGVIDVTTGKLRVTHGKYDLTNLLNYVVSGQTDTTVTAQHTVLLGSYATTTIISNRFSRSIPSGVGRMVYGSPNLYLVLPKDELQSIDQSGIRDWFNNHESYVVYQLETPIEIQLDSITLQALLNENNIWCDTGDTEVKYLLTVGKEVS